MVALYIISAFAGLFLLGFAVLWWMAKVQNETMRITADWD